MTTGGHDRAPGSARHLDAVAVVEERFRWLSGVVDDPVLIVGADGQLVHFNRSAAALLGHEVLAAQIGAGPSDLGRGLLDAETGHLDLVTHDGESAVALVAVSHDTVWDGEPATAIALVPPSADDRRDAEDPGATDTAVVLIEVADAQDPGRTLPAVSELLEVLRPGEGITQAGGAAWCVVWRDRSPEATWARAQQIVDGLTRRVGDRGVVRAGAANQRADEDTPTLLRRCHRGLQQARQDDVDLALDPGQHPALTVAGALRDDVVAERVTAELVPIVDLSTSIPVGALARPSLRGAAVVDPRRDLAAGGSEVAMAFDRLMATSALVQFRNWKSPALTSSLHLPLHGASTRAVEPTLRWLRGALEQLELRPDEVVLGLHEAEIVADPTAIRFLAAARMEGFRTAIRALSGARLPVAALVDLWPDALLLAASVVRGDESRLLPALLAAGDEIGATAIASGVSSHIQLELLLDYECRYATGPLLTRSVDRFHLP